MTVRPTTSGQTPRPGIDRAGKPAAPAAPGRSNDTPAASAAAARRDDVQISAQARELQHLDAGRGAAGEIAPERLRDVLGRISTGYYDQPQVRDEVIRRLAQDL
jgi:hypothetical protein